MNSDQEKPLYICIDKGSEKQVPRLSYLLSLERVDNWHFEVDLDQEWTVESISEFTDWIKKVRPNSVRLIQHKSSKLHKTYLLLFEMLLRICSYLKVSLKVKATDGFVLSAPQIEYLSHGLSSRLSQVTIGDLPNLKALFLNFKEWDIENLDITSCPKLEYIALLPSVVCRDLVHLRIHGEVKECFLCMLESTARSIDISCNQASSLKSLVITGFSDVSSDLFERHPNLTALTIEKAENFQNSDIQKLSSLQKLEALCLSNLPKVTDLSYLSALKSLEVLVITFVPGVDDFSFLEGLTKLKYLYLRVPNISRAIFSGSEKVAVNCMMKPIPEDISRAAERGDITYASIYEWDNPMPWKYHQLFVVQHKTSLSSRFGLYHI